MSPEAQRIAIAGARGFYDFRTFGRRGLVARNPESGTFWGIPCYPSDLNAMHEAEKVLNHEQNRKYRDELCTAVASAAAFGQIGFYWWNATAAQRAEAFLKATGLWSHGGKET